MTTPLPDCPATDIDLKISPEQAILLIRAIATARQKTSSADTDEDLELLRCRISRRLSDLQRRLPQPRVLSSAGRIRVWDEPESLSAA
jgi:hypothetical protein